MSSQRTTRDRLNELLSLELGIHEPERYANTASIDDDLGLDSLDQVELAMAIEEEFNIEISYDLAISFDTIDNMLTYIDKASSEQTTHVWA